MINRDPLDVVLAGHLHLDHTCTRLPLYFDRSKLILHLAHVLLHHLRLLHDLTDIASHVFLSRTPSGSPVSSCR